MARPKLQMPHFHLNKRADGYYDIRYTENGKTKNKSTGTKDAAEAEAERARFVQDYRKPKLGPRPTIAELCDAYMVYRKPHVANPQGLEYCYTPIKRLMRSLYADSITQTVVDDYIDEREDEPVVRGGGRYGDQPVGEATINKELRSLRAALNWAFAEGLIPTKPGFRIELSSGDSRYGWITKDEASKLMSFAPTHLRLFILLALSTAKRRGAILSLTWDKVDLSRRGHEIVHFGDDIGNKKKGSTPISGTPRLVEALKVAHASTDRKTNYVIEFRGEGVRDVKTSLAATAKRAGIQHVGAHMLKHTAITWMVQADMNFERISEFTNTSVEMIRKHYGHHSPSFIAEAQSALAF